MNNTTKFADLPALRQVVPSRFARRVGRLIALVVIAAPFVLMLTPWQQSIKGGGRVVAFSPNDREQVLQSPIYGRIVESWVVEGSEVRAGDRLMLIQDNDPEFIRRLEEQMSALEKKIDAARIKLLAYDSQVLAFEEARLLAIEAAHSHVQVASQKVEASLRAIEATQAAERQARLDLDRRNALHKDGLISTLELEVADRKFQEELAKMRQAKNYLNADRNELDAKEADLKRVGREAQAKIESARAARQEAASDVAVAEQDVSELKVKISRQQTQLVTAPRDGVVVRLLVNPGAEVLKEGSPLLVFLPDTEQRAVELWIDGNDAPLVAGERQASDGLRAGDLVRLQFEGWPAVQFVGWPSVAVGTFGGVVKLVDATDNGKGKFRILVQPDPNTAPWPTSRFLRQGTRANGWVLLRQVSLGFELWRHLNGFPPVVDTTEPASDGKRKAAKNE